ncbi:MAG: LarC family nickel insertion protein [Synechococcaceae bacterium WB6_3B_236]|nr:LarC family nickel insertion protein [Synechococcaceae bacterium WB6_3B_236]
MLLAALFDLGLPEAVVLEPLAALGLADAFCLELQEARSAGLRGRRLQVHLLEAPAPERHWARLRPQLEAAPWPEPLRQRVMAVFECLAEAEATVHGCPPEQVHFHEVGAVDALVDVVGVCAGLLHFGIDHLRASPPPAGHGTVKTAHGILPLPAPAALELARRWQIPLASSEGFPAGELSTPTGLALLAVWVSQFGPAPAHSPAAVGIGLGQRQLDRPNLLRLWQPMAPDPGSDPGPGLDPGGASLEWVVVQQCQIDDMDGEALGFLQEQLRAGGALEVYAQPLQMKKGRPGLQLTALVTPDQAQALRQLWWRHSSSLGLSPWGPVAAKRSGGPAGGRCKPEAEDLARLAQEHGLGWAELRAALQQVDGGTDAGA